MRGLALALLLGISQLAAAAVEPLCDAETLQLIIDYEVGGEAAYRARYTRPIWPGAASGVTVGIGYDLGHQRRAIILDDWQLHAQRERLASAAGVIGDPAKPLARAMQDVRVDWPLARWVFDRTSLVTYYRLARRVFGPDHFDALPVRARCVLVSVVYNRGGSMVGPARVEMRAIRDQCLPARDTRCAATQLRAMVRLWVGSTIEAGMRRRRFAEAALMESA